MADGENSAAPVPSADEVRKLLWAHADASAERILAQIGGTLCLDNLQQFLEGETGLRYPATVAFDATPLEPHQFAEPVFHDQDGERRCCIHVHPRYEAQPNALPFLVAYMAAVINYGDAADADLCEHLGAMLVGDTRQAYYERLCRLADLGVL